MKKKTLVTLLVAVMVAAQPMSALAARSSSTSSSSSSSSSQQSKPKPENNGHATSTDDGQSLSSNGAGSQTENVEAVFAVGAAETAGLPEEVVSSIGSINNGADLALATGNPTLTGYAALTKTAAIVLQNAEGGGAVDQNTMVSLYIPNLIEGLQNVRILCYENATGLWKVVEPAAIDYANHTVSFNMFGSGTVTVIHG